MLKPEHLQYISRAPRAKLDHETLKALAAICANGKTTTLLGFNDYAKHLINMFSETITGVQDEHYTGITYRNITVGTVEFTDTEQFVVCDYEELFEYKKKIYSECHQKRVPFLFAPKYENKSTAVVNFIQQDALYRGIFNATARPASMLSEPGLFSLLEALRSTLPLDGAVAEIGAWQGGAAWHMAKLLELTGSNKRLCTFEMGEALASNNAQGIVCEEQFARDLSFYPRSECYFGPAIAALEAHLNDTKLSFVFIDFGYVENIMDFVWERMVPGAVMLLDNYGHTLGHPDLFDAFLAERGATAIRQHNNPSALVMKHK